MQHKLWIGLEGMEFYAHHGVYDYEREKGGKYMVDAFVYTDATIAEEKDDLSGTVNYELIYEAVSKNMQEPAKLIEHLAHNIIKEMKTFVPATDKIRIKIKKIKPPLDGEVAASVVEMEV
ncbi:MAG: dihydroneopterin aldolase [Chitinophagales bacterium]